MPTMTVRKAASPRRRAKRTLADRASPFTIWSRLLGEDEPMAISVAKFFLKFTFPEEDHRRVAILNERANEGLLSADEKLELDEYIRVDAILSMMKSKARQALAKHGH